MTPEADDDWFDEPTPDAAAVDDAWFDEAATPAAAPPVDEFGLIERLLRPLTRGDQAAPAGLLREGLHGRALHPSATHGFAPQASSSGENGAGGKARRRPNRGAGNDDG